MTPELLFDRSSLINEVGKSLIDWANEMIVILEEHRNDRDSIRVTERIHDRSMQMGLPMTMTTHCHSESEGDVSRDLGLKHCPGERAVFLFEGDGAGCQEGIDAMHRLIEDIESRTAPDKWTGPGMKIAHAIGERELIRSGWKAFAVDPITIRILDHVSRGSFDWYCQEPSFDVKLHMEEPQEGRGMEYLRDPVFQDRMDSRTPAIGNGRKAEATAFGYFDLVRRLGILGANGQRHEKGTIRGDMLFLDKVLPDTIMLASVGRSLDDIVETPMTRGLGLKVLSMEPSNGVKPGIAIRTDARDRLTIMKRRAD
ncbi:hypothetical protein [uncultured Salinicola sp.]|uniref:hypothetical protein n=1 Tax=uncultured Salinicola sp. TaxID=1193542 RepID=UPI00260CE122|nr:hypothetical protein [uncultured Salinicola sp.]|tara:strand:- start:3529 stop:4464 length:936 start_codon:yes stop_codon:yes gene_type:complete